MLLRLQDALELHVRVIRLPSVEPCIDPIRMVGALGKVASVLGSIQTVICVRTKSSLPW
jgi:hypothetical protein